MDCLSIREPPNSRTEREREEERWRERECLIAPGHRKGERGREIEGERGRERVGEREIEGERESKSNQHSIPQSVCSTSHLCPRCCTCVSSSNPVRGQ